MGGGDSARIHPGAKAGELVTWEGLAWPQVCSPGSWKEKEGFQKDWPHQGEGGDGANLLTFSVYMHIQ